MATKGDKVSIQPVLRPDEEDKNNVEGSIGSIPAYGGAGGSQQAADHYAAKDFVDFFGRLPTKTELAMLSSAYMSGDPNKANTSGGRAVVAQYYDNQKNSPDKVYARQQEEYKKGAVQHYGDIDQLFQTSIGRTATTQEKEHFGSLLASGQLDQYQLGQFINELPESVQKQDQEFRGQLSGELQKQDEQYYSEKVLPSITRDLQRRGLSTESTGYASALALAAQDQNRNREGFLSNISAAQYGGRSANARADYQDTLQRYYGLQDYTQNRTNALSDRTYGRITELQDYALQKQAYDEYLRRYGKRGNGASGAATGAISGAATGATVGSAVPGIGTAIGAVGGAVIGGGLGYFGSRGQ